MIDVAKLPTLQAATSTTFTRPPFDNSLIIPEIFAFHARNSQKHPLFIHSDDATGANRKICYPEAYAAIQRAHGIVSHRHGDLTRDAAKSTVVGLLANIGMRWSIEVSLRIQNVILLDTITYFTFVVGIMHAGLTAFPISTRNSVVGVAHLIRTTGLRLLFVSPDPAMQRLARDACAILKGEGITVDIISSPHFEELYNGDNTQGSLAPVRNSPDPVVLILHSSGALYLVFERDIIHSEHIQDPPLSRNQFRF